MNKRRNQPIRSSGNRIPFMDEGLTILLRCRQNCRRTGKAPHSQHRTRMFTGKQPAGFAVGLEKIDKKSEKMFFGKPHRRHPLHSDTMFRAGDHLIHLFFRNNQNDIASRIVKLASHRQSRIKVPARSSACDDCQWIFLRILHLDILCPQMDSFFFVMVVIVWLAGLDTEDLVFPPQKIPR